MGVWIEIVKQFGISQLSAVTPCVGVWIEINAVWGEYLKQNVTPCVGVWIEILWPSASAKRVTGHSLRGSVD